MLKSLLASLLHRPKPAPAPDVASLMERALALHRSGDLDGADALYAEALRTQPDHADAVHLRGVAALQRGTLPRAIELLQHAVALQPGNALYLVHLGEALRQADDLEGALAALESAVARDPGSAAAWNNLGAACIDLGMAARAADCYRRALALKPENVTAHSNLLFALNLVPGVDNRERYAQHLRWAALHADPLVPASRHPATPRQGRRLRIGYVSPDFRNHAMAPFVAPILERHDRERFEVFAYSATPRPDATTGALRALCDHWRDIALLDDAAAAAQVRADGIEVLVDLAGHTNGNRLLMFARRPAPLQATMLGYPFSTGMAAMDCRISDPVADAGPDAAAWNRERLLLMPDSLWCFRPWPDMPAPTPLPALASGRVTFVSLNNPGKLNDEVLAAWSKILARLPGARLRLMPIRRGQAREHLLARLARAGIDVSRVDTHEHSPRAEFWRQAQACDIALDPFPCNGGATTCETLWLGLPVVAMIGDHFVARASFSILSAATLGDLACRGEEDYVERACALAGDLDALAVLRRSMQERLRASALMDEGRYVAGLEAVLEGAWDDLCQPH